MEQTDAFEISSVEQAIKLGVADQEARGRAETSTPQNPSDADKRRLHHEEQHPRGEHPRMHMKYEKEDGAEYIDLVGQTQAHDKGNVKRNEANAPER